MTLIITSSLCGLLLFPWHYFSLFCFGWVKGGKRNANKFILSPYAYAVYLLILSSLTNKHQLAFLSSRCILLWGFLPLSVLSIFVHRNSFTKKKENISFGKFALICLCTVILSKKRRRIYRLVNLHCKFPNFISGVWKFRKTFRLIYCIILPDMGMCYFIFMCLFYLILFYNSYYVRFVNRLWIIINRN